MFEYEESPPPLHHSPSPSDQSQFPSRDTTPVTPVISHPLPGKKPDRGERLLQLPWFKKPINVGRSTTGLSLVDTRLEPDFDDNSFPLFGASASPPRFRMASSASPPLNISARHTSTSPRGNQPSNLTSALQRGDSGENRHLDGMNMEDPKPIPYINHDSSSDFSRMENGARPISMKGKASSSARRESLAQSNGAGMSWGGISVGSWIRDDMVMAGTSPFAFNSPSHHSSSYLPKLEANFMKDFSCCGLTLPTLHDLLQHYEEAHAQKDPVSNDAVQPPMPDTRAALAATTATQVQQEAQQRHQLQLQLQLQLQQQNQLRLGNNTQHNMQFPQQPMQRAGFSSTLQTIPDMDTVDDMEMDDVDETTPPSNLYTRGSATTSPQAPFATMQQQQQQPQIPNLNTTMMQGHQAYRQSAPSTPITASRNSGFHTSGATLSANPMQQFQDLQQPYRQTPDSSAPGTPGELDETLMAGMDDMSMANPLFSNMPDAFGNFGFGNNNDMIDLYIDEPAKRLFQARGSQPQGPAHQRLGSGQYGADSLLAKTIRERQKAAGLPDTTTPMMPHEEPKPFRCPVIGCEKAYKNQNGLKYHKSHGHNNQTLHENGDGTFSIVNPDTQAPYPGTQGMEKEKPYKCDVCQKRYKNLNGLKYHKTHSPPCNPELTLNPSRSPPVNVEGMMPGSGLGSNIGAGLSSDHTMM